MREGMHLQLKYLEIDTPKIFVLPKSTFSSFQTSSILDRLPSIQVWVSRGTKFDGQFASGFVGNVIRSHILGFEPVARTFDQPRYLIAFRGCIKSLWDTEYIINCIYIYNICNLRLF